MRGGIDALKVNRNGLEAEYRAEIKRLQGKIGALVMDNEMAVPSSPPQALPAARRVPPASITSVSNVRAAGLFSPTVLAIRR